MTVWTNRDFTRLFAAQIISLLGSGATTIGLALFAYQLTGGVSATTVIGNALTLRIVAFLLFSQPAGVLADRVNRKAVLVASDLARAALLLLLPFANAIWHVYVLIFAINAVTAFFTPTYEASVPAVVGTDQLVKALSLSRVASDLEAIAAPAAAAVIVALAGARWVFWFDAVTYVVSALLVLASRVPSAATTAREPLSLRVFAAEITHGTRVLVRERSLLKSLVLSFVEAIAGAAVIVGTVAYVRDALGHGDTAVSFAMASVGLGSSIAAVLLSRVTGRYESEVTSKAALHTRRHVWTRRAMFTGGLVLGASLLPGVLLPPIAAVVILWALVGAGQALVAIPSSTLLAEHSFESERGRVFAAHFALTHACWLVTYPAVGHAASRWGTPATFTGAGIVTLVIVAIASLGRAEERRHLHRPAPPV